MSSCLTAFYVPAGRMHQIVGSRDEALLARLLAELSDELAYLDQLDFRRPPPTAEQALREVIDGACTEHDWDKGFVYADVIHLLCKREGTSADNSAFCPFAGAFLTDLDKVIASAGILAAVRFARLTGDGIHDDPRRENFTGVGHWKLADIREAKERMASLSLPAEGAEFEDQWVALRGWLERATESKCDIIGVCSW